MEYSAALAAIGESEARRQGSDIVRFVVSPAEAFRAARTYDLVFISGLFVYLDDDQAAGLMQNLPLACGKETTILLRDGTGVAGRHVIDDRPSDHLQTRYSAIYRTREEYVALFRASGFDLQADTNMFEDGSPLNKYPETRLRLYTFRPAI